MLLLVAIYISTIVEFSVFPSLLLITTLYRLALSIATTRMILIEGHAGHIIDTFGTMVAGGNLVVGHLPWDEVRTKFEGFGFDWVAPPGTLPDEVIERLRCDLGGDPR